VWSGGVVWRCCVVVAWCGVVERCVVVCYGDGGGVVWCGVLLYEMVCWWCVMV